MSTPISGRDLKNRTAPHRSRCGRGAFGRFYAFLKQFETELNAVFQSRFSSKPAMIRSFSKLFHSTLLARVEGKVHNQSDLVTKKGILAELRAMSKCRDDDSLLPMLEKCTFLTLNAINDARAELIWRRKEESYSILTDEGLQIDVFETDIDSSPNGSVCLSMSMFDLRESIVAAVLFIEQKTESGGAKPKPHQLELARAIWQFSQGDKGERQLCAWVTAGGEAGQSELTQFAIKIFNSANMCLSPTRIAEIMNDAAVDFKIN